MLQSMGAGHYLYKKVVQKNISFIGLIILINFIKFYINYKMKKTKVSNMPLDVSIELTNLCNFRCKFCPQSDPNHFKRVKKSYLSIKNVDLILQKLYIFGYNRKLIHWTLDGEPFLNRNIYTIFQLAKNYRFTDQYFATNGSFLTQENVLKLPTGINYTFCIDFCADKEYFEKFRGTKGSWLRIKNNIENLLQQDKLSTYKIILHDIKSFSNISKTQIKKSYSALKSLFPKTPYLIYQQKIFHNAGGFLNNMDNVYKSNYYLCPYPWSGITIASNGNVVACCRDLEHKTILGNVFEQSLEKIWNGKKFVELRYNLKMKNIKKIPSCCNCDLPYNKDKFSLRNIIKTIFNRLGY